MITVTCVQALLYTADCVTHEGMITVACVQALLCTADYVTHEGMLELSGTLECEQPNEYLYNFAGTFALASESK